MLGTQPGEDRLVVVGGLQQALRLRSPIQAAGAVELGRHDELLKRADVGGREDHGLQLVRVELAARHRHMAAELQLDTVLVLAQPLDDAQGLALPHRLDAGMPPPADTVDASDQLGEREDVGGFEVACQRRVQPGGDGVAGLRRLGDQTFEPAQRFELTRDQAGAPAQALRLTAVLGFVGSDLVGLALVLQAVRFGEGFEAGQFERRIRDAGGVDAHQARGAEPVLTLRGCGELVADPGDGGAHRALVGRFAFDAEVALPAFAGIESLDHRAHEREVADVELALPCGADRCEAARRCSGRGAEQRRRITCAPPCPCGLRPLRGRAGQRLVVARVHCASRDSAAARLTRACASSSSTACSPWYSRGRSRKFCRTCALAS